MERLRDASFLRAAPCSSALKTALHKSDNFVYFSLVNNVTSCSPVQRWSYSGVAPVTPGVRSVHLHMISISCSIYNTFLYETLREHASITHFPRPVCTMFFVCTGCFLIFLYEALSHIISAYLQNQGVGLAAVPTKVFLFAFVLLQFGLISR